MDFDVQVAAGDVDLLVGQLQGDAADDKPLGDAHPIIIGITSGVQARGPKKEDEGQKDRNERCCLMPA